MGRTPLGSMRLLNDSASRENTAVRIQTTRINDSADQALCTYEEARVLFARDKNDGMAKQIVVVCYNHYLNYLKAKMLHLLHSQRAAQYEVTRKTMLQTESITGRKVILTTDSTRRTRKHDDIELLNMLRESNSPEEEGDDTEIDTLLSPEPRPKAVPRKMSGAAIWGIGSFNQMFGYPDEQEVARARKERAMKGEHTKKGKHTERQPDPRYLVILQAAQNALAFPYQLEKVSKSLAQQRKGKKPSKQKDLALLSEHEFQNQRIQAAQSLQNTKK